MFQWGLCLHHSFKFRSALLSTQRHHLVRPYATSTPPQAPARESARDANRRENIAIGHSRFIAEAAQDDDWPEGQTKPTGNGKVEQEVQATRQGRLLPTSSHLFKLVLPLPGLRPAKDSSGNDTSNTPSKPPPPTVFLLHPSQPLSHVARLIQASLPSPTDGPQAFNPRLPTVSFQNINSDSEQEQQQWSDSTDIGDFVREAAHSREFQVIVTPDKTKNTAQLAPWDDPSIPHEGGVAEAYAPLKIPVSVPSFEDRTRYLRRRLTRLQGDLKGMQELKDACDALARKGAKRLATGGLMILLTYWAVVFRLTFFSSYGWDVMEPVTYLTEFLFILGGYVWFLRQGREVSYSSILHQSLSTRRRALYTSKGLDIERWAELVTEEKALNKEIDRIREDYEGGWKEQTKSEPKSEEEGPKDKLDEAPPSRAESVLDGPLLSVGEKKAPETTKGGKEDAVVENKRKDVIKDEAAG